MYTNSGTIQRALNAGAQGYISKSADEKEIINACQDYLNKCELGKKHFITPDIDGILRWI